MKHTKGFTLIELIVIISLIAIMLILSLSSLSKSRVKVRDNIRVADIQTIRLALEEYRAQCGVFPKELSLSANNNRVGDFCIITFGDIIGQIPTAPARPNASQLSSTVVSSSSIVNGYFYVGLTSGTDGVGPCYDYHLGVELEFAENNGRDSSGYLNEDHDFVEREGLYDRRCGSSPDFGSNNATTDDLNGLYDFRSANNH
jgi:type II secretory pathway pseudopilin PulG